MIYALALALAAGIGWVSISKVELIATASGTVRFAAKAIPVSHPEGGRATRVHVKDGAEVKAGDVMVDLRNEAVDQAVVRNRASYFALTAEIASLEGEIVEEQPRWPPEIASQPARLSTAVALYRAHQSQIAARRAAAEQEIEQAHNQIADLTPQVKTLSDQVPLLERRARDLGTLAKQGYYSETQQAEARKQLVDAQSRFAQSQHDLKQAEQALAEANERQNLMEREWNTGNRKRLAAARLERDGAQLALAQQSQIEQSLVIRAPIAGIVDGLKIKNVGDAILPGVPVAGIIPAADARRIELEVRVSGSDIGRIRPGAPAVVKLPSFDWTRYGALPGTVREIVDKPAGEAVPQSSFRVVVVLDKDYVDEDSQDHRVTPGMAAIVDFPLGQRTLLADLTDRYGRLIRERLRVH